MESLFIENSLNLPQLETSPSFKLGDLPNLVNGRLDGFNPGLDILHADIDGMIGNIMARCKNSMVDATEIKTQKTRKVFASTIMADLWYG